MALALLGQEGDRIRVRRAAVVGTDRRCEVLLWDEAIEPRHARLARRAGGWWVEPLDGDVELRGEPLDEAARLEDGDELRLGEVPLRVHVTPPLRGAAALAGALVLAAVTTLAAVRAAGDAPAVPAPAPAPAAPAEVEPLPTCAGASCEARARELVARAARAAEQPGERRSYDAWRLLREASALAAASGRAELAREVEEKLRGRAGELERRCAALRFTAARHLALGDEASAREAASRILDAFPGDAHPCRAEGLWLAERLGASAARGEP